MNNITGEPHFEAHLNFIHPLYSKPCWKKNSNFFQWFNSCRFVTETESCIERVQEYNYLHGLFCVLKLDDSLPCTMAIWTMAIVLAMLYNSCLLCISINFLMPNLMSILRYFNLQGHTAGSTLLTILVNFPSAFTILRLCSRSSYVDNIISESIGKCFHCLGVVLPIVAAMKSFKIPKSQYLRDQVMIVPLFLFFLYLIENPSTPANISLGFFFVYAAYLLISMIMNFYDTKAKRNVEEFKARAQPGDMIIELDSEMPIYEINFYNEKISQMYEGKYPIPRIVGVNPRSNAYTNFELFSQFVKSFNIFDATNMNHCNKVFSYFMFIPFVLTNLVIPLVDYDKPNRGWSKLLNCIQLAFCPICCYYQLQKNGEFICILLFVTSAAAIFLFFATSTHTPPSETVQVYLALIGIIISDITYYFINEEQTALLLQTLEYLTTWDTYALNYMLFTVGGILQSCVIVVILCNHELHEMAFGHVMGFIIFHVCCVPGLLFFQSCITKHMDYITLMISDATQSGKTFMSIYVVISFISILMTNFQLRKSHTYIHVTIYIIMNVFIMCSENYLIHPFGSSHNVLKSRLKEANFA